ncbi:MAG TPA: hypothetical protein VFD58_22120 [Blastocatellia bacterium]|nr:hypothetical protein [Blastocatellia bacterium]
MRLSKASHQAMKRSHAGEREKITVPQFLSGSRLLQIAALRSAAVRQILFYLTVFRLPHIHSARIRNAVFTALFQPRVKPGEFLAHGSLYCLAERGYAVD